MSSKQLTWEQKVAEKRAAQKQCIPKAWHLPDSYLEEVKTGNGNVLDVPEKCGLLSPQELLITDKYDVVGLSEELKSRRLSSKVVTTAFCKRAAIAHQLTNCLTEIFFDQAIQRAEYLDSILEKEKRPVGPLHGIPISIKDSFKVKGLDSTIGYVSFIGNRSTTDSPLVKLLLDLGAVLYVKTNIPQTLMTADSDNNVFGRVLNPHKLSLNAGGSSGGEGALIALRGSLLGVGTDIGGSIRIPALCCGIYGFKPTSQRVPYGGQQGPGKPGSPGIQAAAGPLATTLRDCEFFLRNVISKMPWNYDSSSVAVPWRNVTLPGKNLTIGVLIEDPVHPLHPPAARALATAVKTLQKGGHSIIYLNDAPLAGEAYELASHFFSLDNTKTWLQNIRNSGEPLIPSVKQTLDLVDKKPGGYSVADIFDINVARASYIERWNQVWLNNKLDVIIGPGSQTTAVPHDTYGGAPYTTLWNLLDYPGVVIPFGKASKLLDGDELAKTSTEQPPRSYSAEAVDGAPTCIQLTARPLHDEELVQAALIVDGCLKQ